MEVKVTKSEKQYTVICSNQCKTQGTFGLLSPGYSQDMSFPLSSSKSFIIKNIVKKTE